MVKQPEYRKEEPRIFAPTKASSFFTGIILFGGILCPAGLFIFYALMMNKKLGITMLPSLTLGCFTGLVIAAIPAYIFMVLTMRRLKKKNK